MPDYFLRISYDGHDYRGYQWQPGGVVTVQGEIEETLARVHGARVGFHGCGRTDSGVHASQYYGHFNVDQLPENYLFILNKQLPAQITANEVVPVHDKAHARFDATERTYDFFFHFHPDPFLDRFSTLLLPFNSAPASAPLLEMLALLRGTHDLRAFCRTPERHNTTVCTITEVSCYRSPDGSQYRLRFVANRFLRGMIRILAGDLLAIMRGEKQVRDVTDLLASDGRPRQVRLVPPQRIVPERSTLPLL